MCDLPLTFLGAFGSFYIGITGIVCTGSIFVFHFNQGNIYIYKYVILRANWQETEVEKRMCEALRELFADELKEMEAQGIEQGEIRGIELAKKVFRLYAENLSVPQIAAECRITEEKVKDILA